MLSICIYISTFWHLDLFSVRLSGGKKLPNKFLFFLGLMAWAGKIVQTSLNILVVTVQLKLVFLVSLL